MRRGITAFNRLTPAEAERLALLAEECGEIVQMVGKVLRHGYSSHNPVGTDARPNRALLEEEIGQFRYVVSMMVGAGDLTERYMAKAAEVKAERIKQWLRHQETVAAPALAKNLIWNLCSRCGGAGRIAAVFHTPRGVQHGAMKCDVCDGTGRQP